MKRKLLLVASWLMLLLVACGAPPAPAELTESEEEVASDSAETAVEEDMAAEEPAPAGDVPFTAATTIEEAAEPREGDWVKGADDPLLSIVEYGDFQ